MVRTYLYLPETTYKQIRSLAKDQKTSRAQITRQAIEKGLEALNRKRSASIEVLFRLAELGKKLKAKGPRDLSKNMDKYLWDKYKP